MKDFLREIITEAGRISLDFRAKMDGLRVDKKGDKDLVSEADIAVEKFLVDAIGKQYPDHAILGEESGVHDGGKYRWVIDPIDGTTSFVHGQPFYSVSIAVQQHGETVMGMVNAPVLGEIFEATKGQGAFVNGERISVSRRERLADSVLSTGFACVRYDLEPNNMPLFNAMLPVCRDVRRYGSAAIDLCYTACGRLEGFWELNLKVYDVAAGLLILKEAGGEYSDFSGKGEKIPGEVLGTNGLIHDEVLELFARTRQEK